MGCTGRQGAWLPSYKRGQPPERLLRSWGDGVALQWFLAFAVKGTPSCHHLSSDAREDRRESCLGFCSEALSYGCEREDCFGGWFDSIITVQSSAAYFYLAGGRCGVAKLNNPLIWFGIQEQSFNVLSNLKGWEECTSSFRNLRIFILTSNTWPPKPFHPPFRWSSMWGC